MMNTARFANVFACFLSTFLFIAGAKAAEVVDSGPIPTFTMARGNPATIEATDKILRSRAPKPRHTSLTTRAVVAKPIPKLKGKSSGLRSLTSVSCTGTGQPVEIATLAASLKCDPDLIFEYVYNNIEYEPLYGSNKGPLGTLLDLRGNDIDQAQLFVALLSAAGYSSAQINYIYGYVRLTGVQASSWLGVKNDGQAISNLFANGGIPQRNATVNGDGTLNHIDVAQVWVQVQIGGTNYVFDPGFKQHTVSNGLSNLGTVLGYSQSQFLTDAGGTIDSVGISNINRSALRSDLARYANNLVSYIKGQSPALAVSDIVSGKSIQYLVGSPLRQTSLPILSPSQPSGYPMNWGASVPNAYRTCFTISMPGVTNQKCSTATSQNILLYADETYGHRITIFSTGGTCAPPSGSCTPTLLIDGALPPNGQNTGTAANYGTPWSVNVYITHPYTGSLATAANQTKTLKINAGGSYLISAGWGEVGRGMIEKHRTLLAQALAAGGSPSSEAVLGESLAVIGYSWLAEVGDQMRVSDATVKVTTQYHHGVGVVAQAAIQNSGSQGPYVDLPLNFLTLQPQTNYTGTGFPPSSLVAFYTDAGASSSMESAVLEQTQALVSGMQAASTVRVVDINAASGAKTFFADGTTTTGLSAYFASIRPNLTSYSSTDLSFIDHAISTNGLSTGSPAGNQLLLPIAGNIAVGTVPWTGAGYTVSKQTSTSISITQKISGGLSGGFSGNNVPTSTVISSTQNFTFPPSGNPSIPAGAILKAPASFDPVTIEPVDAITGAYVYKHSDLVTGGGAFPYALPFSRTYTSSSNTRDVGLGNGWTHNFDISISRSSDPYAGMGESSAISAAAAITATYISQDLFGSTLDVQHLTLAWIVNRWLTDQLTNNAALVMWPDTSEEFIILPHNDGSTSVAYNPPMGSSVSLIGTNPDTYGNPTTFTYTNKDQSALTFNALNTSLVGQLANWSMPYGMSVSFTYGYSYGGNTYLSQVSNGLGRSLSLSYTGAHVTSVTDDTTRSIAFGYDGNNNLISFTDPLSFLTTFSYDGSASHLTQIFYPSNPSNSFATNTYDALGRVSQQANATGNTTNFYLAGSRSEIIDPAGDRHVTYQTPRGKVLKDDWVLSGSSNVFNDTAQQNGVVNVTANQYDGLDRLALVTPPEGGTTGYVYSADLLNNVVQITSTPKSGSPLSPLTTTYTYDSIYNKVTGITDPLGLVTTLSYDLATGNLLTSVTDASAGAHFRATTTFTYNSVGQVLTATDPLGIVTKYIYDSFGNQTSITRDYGTGHLNQLTQFGYNSLGDITSVTDPNGNVTSSMFDADRRLSNVTTPPTTAAPTGLLTAFTYDADGRVLQTQQSNGGTVLRTTSATYTLTGEPATSTDANGNITRYAYDTVDRLSSVTDPLYRVTSYGYDAMSRQVSVSNLAIQAGPLLAKAYTPDGLLASLTDANSNTASFAYDGLDRLSVTTYPDSPSDKETLAYDADSNIVSRVTRAGDTISFAYDTLNRVCTKATATSPTACGASSGNPTTFYAYDLLGRATGISDNSTAIAVPSGVSASYATTTSYDAWNDPTAVSWSPAPVQATPSQSSVTFGHGFDATNRRVSQTATDSSWWSVPSSASSTSYNANALNQYTAVGAVTPTYDANGNLTFDGTYTYCYDKESRLVSVLSAGTCALPTTTVATYAYDAQGRRKSKTMGGATTLFVTDADNREVLEYDSSGATQHWYAYGRGSNDVLSQMNVAAGTRASLIPDIQGSIIGSLDSGTGTLTKTGYGPYGESSITSGSFRYAAMRIDPEGAALYYDRARMYSTAWGRFLQTDPIGFAGGVNLYSYVGNDPLNLTDWLGLCSDVNGCGPSALQSQAVLASKAGMQGQIGGAIAGAAIDLAVGLPMLLPEAGFGGTAVGTELEASGGEAALSSGLEGNAWRVSLEPQNFTSSFEGGASSSGNVSATLGGEPFELNPNPFLNVTERTVAQEPIPGLVGSPITDFDTSIPAAPTTVGKTITTIGSGLEFVHQMSESAKPNK